MAVTDYSGLVESVQKWVARSDAAFTNRIPDFVMLAEDRIYNGADLEERGPLYSPPLRSDVLETKGALVFDAGSVALPDGFLGFRKLHRPGDRVGLVYMPPERWSVRDAASGGGSPSHFTIEDGQIRTTPGFDGEMQATYWRRLPALSSEAPTNALILRHPMVYLTAVLFEAFSFIQETELAIGHVSRLRAMLDGLNKTMSLARVSGGTLRVTPRNAIP